MKPIRFHPSVQKDIDALLDHYGAIAENLTDGFWVEFEAALADIQQNPERHHFDVNKLRRCNLKRFPYNILYLVKSDRIRIQVIRHNKRNPRFGTNRRRS